MSPTSAEIGRSATKAVLAAAGIQRAGLSRYLGILATLCSGIALRLAASAAVCWTITAKATCTTAGAVGTGRSLTTGVVSVTSLQSQIGREVVRLSP
jgi:hypothetical protein